MDSTWTRLNVGDVLLSPARTITRELRDSLVSLGGYTHPLFATAGDDAGVLPGQALLLIAGGLVEQTGAFDASVRALVGLDQVRFHRPAAVGTRLRVEIRVASKETTGSGRHGLLILYWAVVTDTEPVTDTESVTDTEPVAPAEPAGLLAEATARMLCRTGSGTVG